MQIKSEKRDNPTFHIELDFNSDEVRELIAYMNNQTGPSAPNSFKEILVHLRGMEP